MRAESVIAALLDFDADVLVVTEFRIGPTGDRIRAALTASDYQTTHPPSAPGTNSLFIASRASITSAAPLAADLPEQRHTWRVSTGGLLIVGVYLPQLKLKLPYWRAMIDAAGRPQAPDLFIGDFNTGTNELDKDPKGTPFVGAKFMDDMSETGFVDLWRTRHALDREYTWFSLPGKNGFRLDHAFGSPRFDTQTHACRYDHSPRLDAVSDHSAVIVDVRT